MFIYKIQRELNIFVPIDLWPKFGCHFYRKLSYTCLNYDTILQIPPQGGSICGVTCVYFHL